ncbi:MAG: phosphatase, partial [Candidatus Omnitrophota bacterium]|nr:phosphatase [Candidatus Omnitrophota bacterium]
IAGGGTVGRLHIARAMVRENLVNSIYDAFKTYIGDKCPAYVLGFRLSPQEAIKIIKDAGGISVLAHPYIMNNDELISEFSGFGLRGVEVYYPEHTQGMINHYLDIAKKCNLLVTGGSDYHGEAKPNVKIGSIKVDYELVEKLKRAKI